MVSLKHLFFSLYDTWWSLGAFVTLASAFVAPVLQRRGPRTLSWVTTGCAAIAATALAAALLHMSVYAASPNYLDYGEPTIPLLARNLLNGAPIYAALDSSEMVVGSNYGPLTFIIQAAALLVYPSVFTSKVVGFVCGGFAVAAVYLTMRHLRLSRTEALITVGILLSIVSFELHRWFWNRPDSMLLALVALAVLMADRLQPRTQLVILGALAGLAFNLKAFGPLYLLPSFVAAFFAVGAWRERIVGVSFSALTFAAAAAAPFTLPGVSAAAYFDNLVSMPSQGYLVGGMLQTGIFAIIVASPLILAVRDRGGLGLDDPMTPSLLALAFVFLALTILGGKPGGAPGYPMPLAPLSLYLAVKLAAREGVASPKLGSIALASLIFFCSAPLMSYNMSKIALTVAHYSSEAEKAAEARSLFTQFPDAEMGQGDFNEPSDEFYRAERAFLGQTTRFDHVNFADQRLAGLGVSRVYPLVRDCAVRHWIFARGGDRWARDAYDVPMFDQTFISAFNTNYVLDRRLDHYEVWSCRSAVGSAPPAIIRDALLRQP